MKVKKDDLTEDAAWGFRKRASKGLYKETAKEVSSLHKIAVDYNVLRNWKRN